MKKGIAALFKIFMVKSITDRLDTLKKAQKFCTDHGIAKPSTNVWRVKRDLLKYIQRLYETEQVRSATPTSPFPDPNSSSWNVATQGSPKYQVSPKNQGSRQYQGSPKYQGSRQYHGSPKDQGSPQYHGFFGPDSPVWRGYLRDGTDLLKNE